MQIARFFNYVCNSYTYFGYILKDSPQPQVPLMFGLLKTNSADSLSSTKSISVPVMKLNYLLLL